MRGELSILLLIVFASIALGGLLGFRAGENEARKYVRVLAQIEAKYPGSVMDAVNDIKENEKKKSIIKNAEIGNE
ncbi:MAG: hypothetical protein WC433_01735 [Candidatus Omnitrophota bacterium]